MTETRSEKMTVTGESLVVAWSALIAGLLSLGYCLRHGLVLLYGDAVAHLYIARRIFDSMNPGLNQLGSVWLPLPHLLLVPFVHDTFWWRTGLAGAWVSLPCYVLGCAGIYRLARCWLPVSAAVVAAAFYGLNPGLLYLSTTAMTEPLFLAEMIWATVLIVRFQQTLRSAEAQAAAGIATLAAPRSSAPVPRTALKSKGVPHAGDHDEQPVSLARQLLRLGWLLVAAVFTRYDGWIYAAAGWLLITLSLFFARRSRRPYTIAWAVFTVMLIAAPCIWMAYNAKEFGDPLDFLHGPYSARAIEARTSPGGEAIHPGSNSIRVAAIYYLKAAEMGAVPLRFANFFLLLVIAGTLLAVYRYRAQAIWPALLLWLPLPFYAYSVAYGSVPVFIPVWWPFSYYNTRYGMELLPAFSLFGAALVAALLAFVKKRERLFAALPLLLIVLNLIVLLRQDPLVFKEAQVNARTRLVFERALANELLSLPQDVPILMYTSQNVGAVQFTGMPLKRFVNEGDYFAWRRAMVDPAQAAPYIIAFDGDPVSKAIHDHPQNLTLINLICSTGQPCARVYHSQKFPA